MADRQEIPADGERHEQGTGSDPRQGRGAVLLSCHGGPAGCDIGSGRAKTAALIGLRRRPQL
jgi:hypothetical protein